MAIYSTLCNDDNRAHAAYAISSKADNLTTLHAQSLISSECNANHKRHKSKNKTVFLCNNSIQLRSLTEDKSANKFVSSFQLAAKLYKSNSDEVKITKKRRKGNLKSVLTLPNEPAVLPQSCTVSDMNDTEYFSHIHKLKPQKPKKRPSAMKKSPKPNYNYEYYDRDAAYCSHMDVFLDCSTVDVKNYKGDCRRKVRRVEHSKAESEQSCPSDVWAVLRNINRFQFDPSPAISESSYEVKQRRKKAVRNKLNRGVYETCRTEEIAYFSNIDVNVSREGSLSGSSQITVIDNQVELNKVDNRSFGRNIPLPLVKPMNRRQDLSKNNSKGNKNTILKCNTKKTFASKDTLVGSKSEEKENSNLISSKGKGNKGFEKSLRKNVCTTVEVQTETDLERKEDDINSVGLYTYKSVTSSGTVSDSLQRQNIQGLLKIKVPPQHPSQIRVPRRNGQRSPDIQNASSKVVVRPPGLPFSKLQDNPRVPHQTPVDPMLPLHQTAIRRLLANYKFPLVILGRDQVSGKFEVEQYDYPQFSGLDEHVWPFMVNWMEKSKPPKVNTVAQCKKQPLKNTTHSPGVDDFTIRNKKQQMGASHNNVERKQSDVAKLNPPAYRLQDQVLKFLYKKDSNYNMDKDVLNRLHRDATVNPANTRSITACTSNCNSIEKSVSNIPSKKLRTASPKQKITPRFSTTPPLPTSPSKILIAPQKRVPQKIRGKTTWTSDFIENVINNIKSGTYFTNDAQSKDLRTTKLLQNRTCDLKYNSKEVSIQVTIAEDFTPKVTIQKKKELIIKLPGFDDVAPQMEVQSMTRNQIAVKHCVMNVLLQFDVNVPPEADRNSPRLKRPPSCALLTVTESKTKVFKCKTKIFNAVLPAELCSLVPKVMLQFMDKDASMAVTSSKEEMRVTSLSPISEYAISEIQESIKFPLLPQIKMSPQLIRLRNGKFSKSPKLRTENSNSNDKFYIISIKELPYKYSNVEGLLPLQLSLYRDDCYDYETYEVHPRRALVLNSTEPRSDPSHLSGQGSVTKPNLCTDLVLYTGNKVACGRNALQKAPITALIALFNMMLTCNTIPTTDYFPAIQVQTFNNHVYVNFSINNHQGTGASLCIDTSIFKSELLNKVSTTMTSTSTIVNNERPVKEIEYIKHAAITNITETRRPVPNVAIIKKKGHARYVRLHKKCKSTSHIVAERSSTPLSKVTNLDEFFKAMGAGKLLSSVCDGSCGNKILASISDLRSYISGITPRQALLVMLLANKKDTCNLVRFRPMILQGIAVNRITRATELDMEVEVIENEKFNKMQEYLGTPPIPSPQNNDTLLEELIWIAKTTASDYQRRFDETSEKLLKTLLAKRKRLNPSYLRVMARYVGLGLLKTPVNH